jgi:hypothetical protein
MDSASPQDAGNAGDATATGPDSSPGVDSAAAPDSSATDSGTPSSDTGSGPDDAAADAPPSGDSGGPGDAATGMSIAVPMYIDPSTTAPWAQMTAAAATATLLVANPNSGPGTSADPQYTQTISTAHGVSQSIIGYVHTSYGARVIGDVEADIDSWYSFYPAVDGIFFDEVSTDATTIPGYYQPIHDYVKGKTGRDIVVINPGTAIDEAFMQTADIVMNFEDTYANYTSNSYPQNPSWFANYPPSRFWHIVLSATSVADMQDAVSLARSRNAGYVYITDQGPNTAYQQIVSGTYWQAELTAVQ